MAPSLQTFHSVATGPAGTTSPRPRPRRWPRLVGLGTATPPMRMTQRDVREQLAEVWRLQGARLDRWHRIVAGSGIDARYGVLPIRHVCGLSTKARMEAYERHAPILAREAAGRALGSAGIEPSQVTDLVVVSCTGFSAPGLDVSLVEDLGLRPTVRRTLVGFMGCVGAIIGLRTAVGACLTHPRSVALVLCLELCSLHLRPDRSAQNQVASAIFGDGAAAAIVTATGGLGGGAGALGRISPGQARLIARGRDWMTWRITDAGFAMTLDRRVPAALRETVATIVDDVSPSQPGCFIVHPGGPAILDAVDEGLGLRGGSGLEVARDVLRRCGNMSSATVLFVLEEALRRAYRPPALLLAFGPGLAVETLVVLP